LKQPRPARLARSRARYQWCLRALSCVRSGWSRHIDAVLRRVGAQAGGRPARRPAAALRRRRLEGSPRHRLTPFPPPHPTPHPSFPPQPLGPARQRVSGAWGRLAGAPALRRRRLPPSLTPEPRARLLSFSSTCLQSRLSVVRYAGSKIFQRNVIVPLHEQHISLRRILIVLQLRATSLILAL